MTERRQLDPTHSLYPLELNRKPFFQPPSRFSFMRLYHPAYTPSGNRGPERQGWRQSVRRPAGGL